MTSALAIYLRRTAAMLIARARWRGEDSEEEDAILEELDGLWEALDEGERLEASRCSWKYARLSADAKPRGKAP